MNKEFNEVFMELSEKDQKSIINLIQVKNMMKESKLQQRINKAIEYIENNAKPYAFSDKMLKKECILKLLEILKGDSNE